MTTKKATAPTITTLLNCSECQYVFHPGIYRAQAKRNPCRTVYVCDKCGHTITAADVQLEAGETLTTVHGALGYTVKADA